MYSASRGHYAVDVAVFLAYGAVEPQRKVDRRLAERYYQRTVCGKSKTCDINELTYQFEYIVLSGSKVDRDIRL